MKSEQDNHVFMTSIYIIIEFQETSELIVWTSSSRLNVTKVVKDLCSPVELYLFQE